MKRFQTQINETILYRFKIPVNRHLFDGIIGEKCMKNVPVMFDHFKHRRSAMGLSAVCDCGHTHLLFLYKNMR